MNDLAVVAELTLCCAEHQKQVLATYALCADGQVRVMGEAPGWSEQNAPDGDGSSSHLREVLKCPVGGCEYDAKIVGASDVIEDALRVLADSATPTLRTEWHQLIRVLKRNR